VDIVFKSSSPIAEIALNVQLHRNFFHMSDLIVEDTLQAMLADENMSATPASVRALASPTGSSRLPITTVPRQAFSLEQGVISRYLSEEFIPEKEGILIRLGSSFSLLE
jgi:hypothetical protein